MFRSSLPIVGLLLCGLAVAQEPPTPSAEPLGSALEGYAYPYPVHYLPLKLEGQDLRMAYMDVPAASGEGGSPVLLLHGKNFFGAYWKDTIEALRQAGHRVIVPDQIGFGKSSKPELRYSFHLLASNTKALLDSLGVDKVDVVGHSMGGMVAVRFTLLYPEVVTHLVLEDPIGLEDYRFLVPYTPTEELYRKAMAQTEDAIRAYHKTYYPTWDPRYEKYVQVQWRWTLGAEAPRLAMVSALTSQMIYEQPVVHELSLIKAKTLVVVGLKDRTAPGKDAASPEAKTKLGLYPELGKKTAAAIPGAKLIELENVGHIPHLQAPQDFHPALIEFLKP